MRTSLRSFLIVMLLFVAVGCAPSATLPAATDSDTGNPVALDTGCLSRDAYGTLEENVPYNGVMVEAPILFRWYYYPKSGEEIDWDTACVPTAYTLHLSPGPDFSEDIAIDVTLPEITVERDKLFVLTRIDIPLAPHTYYRWMVVGHAGEITLDEEQLALFQVPEAWVSPQAGLRPQMGGAFTTGPVCDTQTIQPVQLLQPAVEAVIDTDTPLFQWDMPGCTSSAFLFEISTDPDFDEELGGPHVPPADTNPLYKGWVTSNPQLLMYPGFLQPCGQYFWRVSAGLYSWEYHIQLGEWATVSDPYWFTYAGSNCQTAGPATVTPAADAACREGTSQAFEVVEFVRAGTVVPVLAVNPGKTWAFVRTPADQQCWVWLGNSDVHGDLAAVKTMPDPPVPVIPPTATPVVCGSIGDKQVCLAAGCQWVNQLCK